MVWNSGRLCVVTQTSNTCHVVFRQCSIFWEMTIFRTNGNGSSDQRGFGRMAMPTGRRTNGSSDQCHSMGRRTNEFSDQRQFFRTSGPSDKWHTFPDQWHYFGPTALFRTNDTFSDQGHFFGLITLFRTNELSDQYIFGPIGFRTNK